MSGRGVRVQLWSYNYAPEPSGIGPVSTTLAERLRDRGHEVQVVAAHPHYPEPRWGQRIRPYRELRSGIPLLRLPLWIGRDTPRARLRQELSFTGSLVAALPFLGRPDVVLAASPSFPALLPAVWFSRLRRIPLVVWLHDVLPDGAVSTGQVDEGPVLIASRWLERTAYRNAARIVVLSQRFIDNLRAKSVPDEKLRLIYDPATISPAESREPTAHLDGEFRVLCMGNIGHTQGLPQLVRAFDRSELARQRRARLVLTGTGVALEETRAQISSSQIELRGVVSAEELDRELHRAAVGLVTQQYDGTEFNLPSKIMNYMMYALPIVAAVNPSSEVAALVEESGAGWVVDSSQPDQFPATLARVLADPAELERRGQDARRFGATNFGQDTFAERFEEVLLEAIGRAGA